VYLLLSVKKPAKLWKNRLTKIFYACPLLDLGHGGVVQNPGPDFFYFAMTIHEDCLGCELKTIADSRGRIYLHDDRNIAKLMLRSKVGCGGGGYIYFDWPNGVGVELRN